MTRIFTLCVVLAVAAGTAHAQGEPSTATFLEKRVPDELAVEGVMLSRRNLSLRIEPIGDQVVISLVELNTGRIAASTKLDSMPADREAAVAAVTHVVAELAKQVGPAPQGETRAEHVQDELAEQRYRSDALRLGERYELDGGKYPSLSRQWIVYRGEQNHELDPASFYQTIGRPDLGKIYAERIGYRDTAIVAGSVMVVAGFVVIGVGMAHSSSESSGPTCDPNGSFADFSNCVSAGQQAQAKGSDDMKTALVPGLLLLVGGGISFAIAGYYHHNAHPITENEAMSLADAYNHGLRHTLGLPTAQREPVIKSLKLTPFTTSTTDGGIALGGTF